MANDMSSCSITCRLCEDIKMVSGKLAVLRVAWNSWDSQASEEVGNFIDVKLLGERWQGKISDYLTKGSRVALSGDLRQETWESDGQRRSKHVLIAREVVLLGGDGNPVNDGKVAQPASRPATTTPASPDDFDW